jgi:Cof subfamily protein (haloacid dehalogenase superfamily)
VASDVDGTLLNTAEAISPRTAAAIAAVRAAEVPFVLVSGRPPRWIGPVSADGLIDGYAVCANGAVLYDIDADRVLSSHPIPAVLLRDVVHTLDAALPGTTIAVERIGDSAFGLDGREFLIEDGYRHAWTGDPHQISPRDEMLGRPAVKLLVRTPGATSAEIAAAAEAVVGGAVQITYSTNVGMIEVSAAGVTKQTGLAEVAGWLDVAAEDIVAFGDMPNDVPMLCWVGHGVAMANGHADALAAADEVTAANTEDGVAQVLERWF